MLQTSLLLMKSLNKTETPVFLSVVCSLFPKAIFLMFILVPILIISSPIIYTCNKSPCQSCLVHTLEESK